MSKERAFVRYTKSGKIVPGSLILTQGSYPSGPGTWKEITTDLCCENNNTMNYKVYTALLTSNGTDDPTPTVLENTLGSDVIWRREQEGVYYGENINFADPSKVFIIITPNNSSFGNGNIVYAGSDVYDDGTGNVVYFSTRFLGGSLSDSWGTYIPIEIRVYP